VIALIAAALATNMKDYHAHDRAQSDLLCGPRSGGVMA